MSANVTPEYWRDGEWYVGRLREIPGIFSQGKTLPELEANIRDAYRLMVEEQPAVGHPLSDPRISPFPRETPRPDPGIAGSLIGFSLSSKIQIYETTI